MVYNVFDLVACLEKLGLGSKSSISCLRLSAAFIYISVSENLPLYQKFVIMEAFHLLYPAKTHNCVKKSMHGGGGWLRRTGKVVARRWWNGGFTWNSGENALIWCKQRTNRVWPNHAYGPFDHGLEMKINGGDRTTEWYMNIGWNNYETKNFNVKHKTLVMTEIQRNAMKMLWIAIVCGGTQHGGGRLDLSRQIVRSNGRSRLHQRIAITMDDRDAHFIICDAIGMCDGRRIMD